MAQISDTFTRQTTAGRPASSDVGTGPVTDIASPSEADGTWARSFPHGYPGAPAAHSIARRRVKGIKYGERKLLQALLDWSVVTSGALFILAESGQSYNQGDVLFTLGAVTLLWFFFAGALDAYSLQVLQSRFRSTYAAAKVLIVSGMAYLFLAWLTGGFLPLIRLHLGQILLALLLLGPLLLVRALLTSVLSREPLRSHLAVVGANRHGREMVNALGRYDGNSYEFLGYFDDSPEQHVGVVHTTSDLLEAHAVLGIDQVVLANPCPTGLLTHTLSLLHEQGVQITPMFALYQDLTGRVPVSHLGDDWYVALPAHVKSTSRPYLLLKRLFDICLSLLLLLLSAPLIPLIALAIRLDSRGPVFFKQVRVGRGGRPFKMVKFRSMRTDAEVHSGPIWSMQNDARITRVGRFLRKSRLDEIPQLWNVLLGEMSFVGPRPERPEFDEQLEREIPFYRARRAVRPGLTGWAQVNYGYGSSLLDTLRKVEYDLYYIKNESLYLDLQILLRTLGVVLKLQGR